MSTAKKAIKKPLIYCRTATKPRPLSLAKQERPAGRLRNAADTMSWVSSSMKVCQGWKSTVREWANFSTICGAIADAVRTPLSPTTYAPSVGSRLPSSTTSTSFESLGLNWSTLRAAVARPGTV